MRKMKRNDVYAKVKKRARAIASILAGDSRVETAKKLGVSRQAVYNLLKNPRFQEELAMARMALFSRLAYLMGSSLAPAVTYLKDVVEGKEPPDELRIRAASALLNNSRVFDALAYEELRSQVEKLRRATAVAPAETLPEISGAKHDHQQTNQGAAAGDSRNDVFADEHEGDTAADTALELLEEDL